MVYRILLGLLELLGNEWKRRVHISGAACFDSEGAA